jgi:nucleotide-binding universal stress UspA family protein
MFHHLLVPLDGSLEAEDALPLAAHIARRTGGTLSLVHAVSCASPSNAGIFAAEMHHALIREAKEDLERLAQTDLLAEIPLHMEVLTEGPAQAILSYAQSQHIDLIVLCSHGSTGFKRWTLGSVAQYIARHSPVPVVILQERSRQTSLYHPEMAQPVRALVGLDGSSLAEAVLLPTAYLVALVSPSITAGELHLIQVIPSLNASKERICRKYDFDRQALRFHDAEHYLSTTKNRLIQRLAADLKLQVTFSIVEDADAATALIKAAEMGDALLARGYDLIALATHGRSGIKSWMAGSIAERVIESATLPLLIVQPHLSTTGSSS